MTDVAWKNEPDAHEYPAAEAYLSLLFTSKDVGIVLLSLRSAPISASSSPATSSTRAAHCAMTAPFHYRRGASCCKRACVAWHQLIQLPPSTFSVCAVM